MPDPEFAPAVPPSPSTVEQVRALLAAAGLTPSPAETEILASAYPVLRAVADRLYPLVYDDDPAPVFDSVPLFRAVREA
jgi:hypothetical protein